MRRYSPREPDPGQTSWNDPARQPESPAAPGLRADAPPRAPSSSIPAGSNAPRPAGAQRTARPAGVPMARAQAESRLVERVFYRCHAHIAEIAQASSVPARFLGALTANESAGALDAARFEPAVYRHLVAVASGEAPAYAGIQSAEIERQIEDRLHPKAEFHGRYLTPAFAAGQGEQNAALRDEVLRELATSWGFTQIMGYHVLGRGRSVRDLVDPGCHYGLAVELLAEFARDYHLDLGREFEPMFRCWNTGQPHGKTYDPAYVENGVRRMGLYAEVAAQATFPPVDGG